MPVEPWNNDVNGTQVLPLINDECAILRVQAGPGTGKTFGLKRRVLRLLHPNGLNAPVERVLVCAFNRVIAEELRSEIKAELANYGIELPIIRTIHGLCSDLVGGKSRLLLPQETETMMYDVRHRNPSLARQFENKHSKMLRALREHESSIRTHTSLKQAVDQWLADHSSSLVGGLPREVERRLASGDFESNNYDHIIVDEFQDLTDFEVRIVTKLLSATGSLVALGDRKQSIYAFRGNVREGLLKLQDYVETPVTDLTMDQCQRCPISIIRLANSVMELENEPLIPTSQGLGQIHNVYSPTPSSEAKELAPHIIQNYLRNPNKKHLILVTRRTWGYNLRNELRALDEEIKISTVFAEDVLETWPVREAFLFLSILANQQDSASIREWIAYKEPDLEGRFKPSQRNAVAYSRLRDRVGMLTVSKIRDLLNQGLPLHGAGAGYVNERMIRLINLLDSPECAIRIETFEEDILRVLASERWIRSTGENQILAQDDLERIRKECLAIIHEERDVDENTLSHLMSKLRYRIAIRESIGETAQADGIRIVTLWGAKGLTADYVYIVGLVDEAVPGRCDFDSSGLEPAEYLDEQRRLLYVSLTRAKKVLVLSRPQKIKVGEIGALNLAKPTQRDRNWAILKQTRFLEDIGPDILPNAVPLNGWTGIQAES